MFAGEHVIVVTLMSHPRSLEYIKPFRHMVLVDSRLDFSIKKDFMNDRVWKSLLPYLIGHITLT